MPSSLLRLSGRKTCDRVLRQGRVWKGPLLAARWLPLPPHTKERIPPTGAIFVGTMVSAALEKSAVRRNRMRRRCREALRIAVREMPRVPTVQLLLCPRSASLDAPFPELQAQVCKLLAALSSACPPTDGHASSNSR